MNNLYDILNIDDKNLVDVKQCIRCGLNKPLFSFQKNRKSFDNRCRDCKLSYQKELRQVRNTHQIPPMPDNCDCCGKLNPKGKVYGATNLALDHHYDENGKPFFRGWICKQCNSGIGYLGDTATSVYKAFNYLLKSLSPEQEYNVLCSILNMYTPEEQEKILNGDPNAKIILIKSEEKNESV
jgi:hypothetical protein